MFLAFGLYQDLDFTSDADECFFFFHVIYFIFIFLLKIFLNFLFYIGV